MSEYVEVVNLLDLPPGSSRAFVIHGKRIAVFNVAGEIYAIDDMCSHAGASLAEGIIEGHSVICSFHGARFDLKTGRHLSPPAFDPVACYQVKQVQGKVFISI